ncbi:MAG: cytochrome c3 family protein [Planctomycetota bacterium]
MKLRDPKLWLSLVSLALVVALVVVDLERTSPGPLSDVHAVLGQLQGGSGCDECHGSGERGMARACSSCHAEIADQLLTGTGVHGRLTGDNGHDCAACHVEHHGDEFPLAGDFAFLRIGYDSVGAFDHAHTEFDLRGAHDALVCSDCHENADVRVLPEGHPRFLGSSQECSTCHDDPHEGRYSNSCATCHGQERPFATVASFAHGDAFPLVGAHGVPGCIDCHPTDGPHAIAVLATSTTHEATRTCAQCHDEPHRDAFLASAAALANVPVGDSCAICHDAVHESFFEGATTTREQHACTGFDLDAPHDAVTCAQCHGTRDGGDFASRFPGRSRNACEACHADPHGGQFAAGGPSAFAGAACVVCHAVDAFHPDTFDAAKHARTPFELTGAHLGAECSSCHEGAHTGDDVVPFGAADTSCAACHTDAHHGRIDVAKGEGCAECHTTESFSQVDRAAFDHGATSFALRGAHLAIDCETCHVPTSSPDATGRTFGRVAPATNDGYAGCSGCHADVHADRFTPGAEVAHMDPVAAAHLAGDRAGCARCHTEDSFAVVTGFDHGAWTGFQLDGAHDAVTCQACHGPGGSGSRSFGLVHERRRGSFDVCATCHADPHGGTFDEIGRPRTVDGRTSCARCHTTSSFDAANGGVFDHAMWTAFPLEGAHDAVACAACHTGPRANAGGMQLGTAPGTRCADCHADPHVGQFAVGGRTDCAACHDSTLTFEHLDFDHATDTRFPLDAQHVALDCSSCHVEQELPGGLRVVRYKPLGTACADCHSTGGRR